MQTIKTFTHVGGLPAAIGSNRRLNRQSGRGVRHALSESGRVDYRTLRYVAVCGEVILSHYAGVDPLEPIRSPICEVVDGAPTVIECKKCRKLLGSG